MGRVQFFEIRQRELFTHIYLFLFAMIQQDDFHSVQICQCCISLDEGQSVLYLVLELAILDRPCIPKTQVDILTFFVFRQSYGTNGQWPWAATCKLSTKYSVLLYSSFPVRWGQQWYV